MLKVSFVVPSTHYLCHFMYYYMFSIQVLASCHSFLRHSSLLGAFVRFVFYFLKQKHHLAGGIFGHRELLNKIVTWNMNNSMST